MNSFRYFINALARFAFILAVFVLVSSLFKGRLTIQWRDVFIAGVMTITLIIQNNIAKRRQEKIDEELERNRERQSW